MNKSLVKYNYHTDQKTITPQPQEMKSYPLSVILTINLEMVSDSAYAQKNRSDTQIRAIILDKLKEQLNTEDRVEHLLDYNFRVIINDKARPAELTELCKRLVSSVGFKDNNNSSNGPNKKRIILHFITLTKLCSYTNKTKHSHPQFEKNNTYPSTRFFDISATNSNGEIPC